MTSNSLSVGRQSHTYPWKGGARGEDGDRIAVLGSDDMAATGGSRNEGVARETLGITTSIAEAEV